MSSIRYFRSSPEIYNNICIQLDEAYGYPRSETLTERTLPKVDDLPTDTMDRVYLAVSAHYCDYILPSQLLSNLLSNGSIEEITAENYNSVLPEIYD